MAECERGLLEGDGNLMSRQQGGVQESGCVKDLGQAREFGSFRNLFLLIYTSYAALLRARGVFWWNFGTSVQLFHDYTDKDKVKT